MKMTTKFHQCVGVLFLAFLAAPRISIADAGTSGELTVAGLTGWLEAYGEAWESRDADKASRLFSEGSIYQVSPYEQPHTGREGIHVYWSEVTKDQRNVDFEFQVLSVAGYTGIAHWSAEFDAASSSARIRLDGIFVLEFNEDGRCRQLREWWHLQSNEGPGNAE